MIYNLPAACKRRRAPGNYSSQKFMPSHLSDIGFQIEDEEAFQQLASQAYEEGETFDAGGGTYIRWAPGGGVELWLQLDHEDDIVGINPHYAGRSLMRAGLTQRLTRPEGAPLDGAFYAWANPVGEEANSGDFPFVFDAPDYHLNSALSLPSIVDVRLAAFAHELQSYESDEAYDESQPEEMKFASESFIPSGMFDPGGGSIEPPLAHAIFTGHVLETSINTNPATNNEFIWARVRTLGGEIDVVADPVLLNGPLVVGGVVSGAFWLSGQIVKPR
jgi:hypothetical protein